ncbi:MAG TPA: cupredoxin domain-containing protein [Candidatus Binataceae bacterium]|nr:cupredoxin domain-containing protein [Candidatus Binataceae bacterium]
MKRVALRVLAFAAFAAAFAIAPMSRAADAPAPAAANEKDFTLVAVMLGDSKFWLPSTIVVNEGDKVKLTLRNEIPGEANQHGFSIPEYHIEEVVTRGTPKTVEFVADKPGVFNYVCQMHPAHIGGQLIVRAKAGIRPAAAKH